MDKPITILKPTFCIKCNKETIECYDNFNKSINYVLFVNNRNNPHINEKLDRYNLSYFKCTNCGEKYSIKWDNKFPVPLLNHYDLNWFLDVFTHEDYKRKK